MNPWTEDDRDKVQYWLEQRLEAQAKRDSLEAKVNVVGDITLACTGCGYAQCSCIYQEWAAKQDRALIGLRWDNAGRYVLGAEVIGTVVYFAEVAQFKALHLKGFGLARTMMFDTRDAAQAWVEEQCKPKPVGEWGTDSLGDPAYRIDGKLVGGICPGTSRHKGQHFACMEGSPVSAYFDTLVEAKAWVEAQCAS